MNIFRKYLNIYGAHFLWECIPNRPGAFLKALPDSKVLLKCTTNNELSVDLSALPGAVIFSPPSSALHWG